MDACVPVRRRTDGTAASSRLFSRVVPGVRPRAKELPMFASSSSWIKWLGGAVVATALAFIAVYLPLFSCGNALSRRSAMFSWMGNCTGRVHLFLEGLLVDVVDLGFGRALDLRDACSRISLAWVSPWCGA